MLPNREFEGVGLDKAAKLVVQLEIKNEWWQ